MPSIVFDKNIEKATQFIVQGKIILYPTDTIWGIGCDATREESIQRIFEIKNRPSNKSMILLVADIGQLEQYVKITPFILDFLAQQTKPTTVIYPNTKIPLATSVYAKDGSVAIRVVKHQFCQALIKKMNVPLVSTSANLSNQPTPHSFEKINLVIKKNVDFVVPQIFEQSMMDTPSQIISFTNTNEIKWIRK